MWAEVVAAWAGLWQDKDSLRGRPIACGFAVGESLDLKVAVDSESGQTKRKT